MTASMTAYGRTEETNETGHIIWEIRSVNHRYLVAFAVFQVIFL